MPHGQDAKMSFAYVVGDLRVIADEAGFTLKVVAVEVHDGLELAVDVRVGVRGHHLVLLLQQGNGPLGKGLAQRLLGTRGIRKGEEKV